MQHHAGFPGAAGDQCGVEPFGCAVNGQQAHRPCLTCATSAA
jgi:hypothetical protein